MKAFVLLNGFAFILTSFPRFETITCLHMVAVIITTPIVLYYAIKQRSNYWYIVKQKILTTPFIISLLIC